MTRLVVLSASMLAGACNAPANNEHSVGRASLDEASITLEHLRCGEPELLPETASTPARQLVTFAASGDCLVCGPHLAGLDTLRQRRQLPYAHRLVIYASAHDEPRMRRTLRAQIDAPPCFDHAGSLWQAVELGKTPVTVLLVNGRVMDEDRSALDTDERRASYAARVMARGRAVP
jgi:hypothetical protein